MIRNNLCKKKCTLIKLCHWFWLTPWCSRLYSWTLYSHRQNKCNIILLSPLKQRDCLPACPCPPVWTIGPTRWQQKCWSISWSILWMSLHCAYIMKLWHFTHVHVAREFCEVPHCQKSVEFKEQNTLLRALWACTRVTNKPEGFFFTPGQPNKAWSKVFCSYDSSLIVFGCSTAWYPLGIRLRCTMVGLSCTRKGPFWSPKTFWIAIILGRVRTMLINHWQDWPLGWSYQSKV